MDEIEKHLNERETDAVSVVISASNHTSVNKSLFLFAENVQSNAQVKLGDGENDDMGDDVWADDAEDHNEFRDRVVIEKNLKQAGYRDGKAEAGELAHQRGFDAGFKEAMIIGDFVGKFIGEAVIYAAELTSSHETELVAVIEEIAKSLMMKGSQEKYSDEYLESIASSIQSLNSPLQQSFQNMVINIDNARQKPIDS